MTAIRGARRRTATTATHSDERFVHDDLPVLGEGLRDDQCGEDGWRQELEAEPSR